MIETEVSPAVRDDLFERIGAAWTRLGDEAPHWSVLSSDQYRPERIKEAEEEFFRSGIAEVDLILDALGRNEIDERAIQTVCEFGCGLGRATAHLAQRFSQVHALDISSSHLALAKSRHVADNITWKQTSVSDLAPPEPVDLWFSRLVLQHNPPPMIAAILKASFASLNPGGLAIFQVPTSCPGYAFEVEIYLQRTDLGEIEMHLIPQRHVFAIAHAAGLAPLEVIENDAGVAGWTSHLFVFRKPD